MIEATVDRARRLLGDVATDHIADLLASTEDFHRDMDDRPFVGLCLTLIATRFRIAAEATAKAQTDAIQRGTIYRGGTLYKVRPAD